MKGIKRPAVFFDRDGTINEDVGYLSKPEGLKMIEGAGAAIKKLNGSGVMVIVVSNQSGVGRGYFTGSDVEAVNRRLVEALGAEGARLDGIYYCAHRPDEDCNCRKPRTGLADMAVEEHGVDTGRSYVVGDKASDVGLAENIGAKGVLVLTGNGSEELEKLKKLKRRPDFVAGDISEAVNWIISDLKGRSR